VLHEDFVVVFPTDWQLQREASAFAKAEPGIESPGCLVRGETQMMSF
jgi:hypothetical protein